MGTLEPPHASPVKVTTGGILGKVTPGNRPAIRKQGDDVSHQATTSICSAVVAALLAASSAFAMPTTALALDSQQGSSPDTITLQRLDDLYRTYEYENPYEDLREQANLSFEGVQGTDQREIVCWGDSMTEGYGSDEGSVQVDGDEYDISYKAYPQVLQELTGIKAYNFGVPGATSQDIALMQGAYTLDNLKEPIRIFDAHIASQGAQHPGDILILEIGSNGGWDNKYKRLINQYRAMIEHSGCQDYLILGDTDDPGTSLGDLRQEAFEYGEGPGQTTWEAKLSEAFGDHFINMRVFLIERGLETCDREATRSDANMAAYGRISDRLRSDWTHLNCYGYYAKAVAIYERGAELGYWGPNHKVPLESALAPSAPTS